MTIFYLVHAEILKEISIKHSTVIRQITLKMKNKHPFTSLINASQ